MATLQRNNWPLGWIPSDDQNNGRREGLLRMDNLTLDTKGIVRCVQGTKKVSGIFGTGFKHIYAKVTAGKKLRYSHNSNGTILRNYGGAGTISAFDQPVLTGGDASYSGFGSAFDYNLICCGNQRKKDNGTTISDIGVAQPSAPSFSVNTPPEVDMLRKDPIFHTFGFWDTAAIENDGTYDKSGDALEINTNPDTNRAIAQAGITSAFTLDATDLGGSGNGTDNDTYTIAMRIGDTGTFVKFRIEYLLGTLSISGVSPDADDYYWKEFKVEEFRQGLDAWSTLNCKRGDFTRNGNDDSLNWANVAGIRVIWTVTQQQSMLLSYGNFQGGSTGPLNGRYQYRQINYFQDGVYQDMSIASDSSGEQDNKSTSNLVTPASLGSATKAWIYRFGGTLTEWTGVSIRDNVTPFTDSMSDADAQANFAGFEERFRTINEQLEALPDNIIGILGPFYDRVLYLTTTSVYVSEPNMPGILDSRHVYKISSSSNEINLWMAKVSESQILIGTTADIYSFSGRGEELDAGLLDFAKTPLGIPQAPISWAYAVEDNAVTYQAHDGWRVLKGSSSELITKELHKLYRGETSHGIAGLRAGYANTVFSYCCFAKNKFIAAVEHLVFGRALHVYNSIVNTWELPYFNITAFKPIALCVEEDGTILCGSDNQYYIREIYTGDSFDETDAYPIELLTIYDNDGKFFNRKETTIFKMKADTGNQPVTITITADGSSSVLDSFTLTFNGVEEKYHKIRSTVGKRKSFQVRMVGDFEVFELHSFCIEYEELPKQEAVVRVPNNNLGTSHRKRFINFPIVIDCMGNNVTVTPIVDDTEVTANATVFSHDGKFTELLWFTSEKVGTDLGVLIEAASGYFELYNLPLDEAVSEKMPTPSKYTVVPHSNLGTNQRKRFNNIPFVCDPRSATITVTPIVDGVSGTAQTFTAAFRKTFVYEFNDDSGNPTDVICTDVGLIISGDGPFEFYEMLKPKEMEVLPDPIKYLRTSETNFGIYAYKQFNNLPFVLNSGGETVSIVPILDGVEQTAQTFSSSYKKTHTYLFSTDVRAIDVALKISCADGFIEFYEILKPQTLEIMPELTTYLRITPNNYGIASKKRLRVIPFTINTFGHDVVFTPLIDGTTYSGQTVNTSRKTTVFYYFTGTTDIFCIDISGSLSGDFVFEFFGLERPETVETLPVAKKFDQIGPANFDRQGLLRFVNLRLITEGTTLNYQIFQQDDVVLSSSIPTIANKENMYRIAIPKGVNPSIFRMEMWSSNPFHRLDASVEIFLSGKDTDAKIVRLK
jgi:hypothetical protein